MLRLIVALGISTLAACGGSGTTGDGGSDPAALCTHPPANSAPQITDAYSASAFSSSVATGGMLESGTYYMTAITNYEKASGNGTHQDTMVIDATTGSFVVAEVNGGSTRPTIAGTLAPSGTALTETTVCPASMTVTLQYSASAGMLTIYQPEAKSVSTWTKQ